MFYFYLYTFLFGNNFSNLNEQGKIFKNGEKCFIFWQQKLLSLILDKQSKIIKFKKIKMMSENKDQKK